MHMQDVYAVYIQDVWKILKSSQMYYLLVDAISGEDFSFM